MKEFHGWAFVGVFGATKSDIHYLNLSEKWDPTDDESIKSLTTSPCSVEHRPARSNIAVGSISALAEPHRPISGEGKPSPQNSGASIYWGYFMGTQWDVSYGFSQGCPTYRGLPLLVRFHLYVPIWFSLIWGVGSNYYTSAGFIVGFPCYCYLWWSKLTHSGMG